MDASAIDNAPMFKMLTGLIFEDLPKAVGRAGGAIVGGIGSALDTGLSLIGDTVKTGLGSGLSLGSNGPEITPVVQTPVIQQAVSAHHFDPKDLGSLAPPSFGNIGRGGAGLGV